MIYVPGMSKNELFAMANEHVAACARLWNVSMPPVRIGARPGARRYSTGGTLMGEYLSNPATIWVNVPLASTPAVVRGRKWSYPGYKVDRTCAGILAHEMGHHVWRCKRISQAWWLPRYNPREAVSGYEPIPEEAFAETMRVFTFNPDLLRRARPQRYAALMALGLKPPTQKSWQDVLQNAPDFIKAQAQKWASNPR